MAEPGQQPEGRGALSGDTGHGTYQQTAPGAFKQFSAGRYDGRIHRGWFPIFINRRMLEYLGYENETEFVSDIEGMITNCMHPDDREQGGPAGGLHQLQQSERSMWWNTG